MRRPTRKHMSRSILEKNQIFLIINLLMSIGLYGQTTDLETVKLNPAFSWSTRLAKQDSFYFKLPVVQHSEYLSHFRISLTGQTIDFFSKDNERFEGLLTNTIIEYKPVKMDWGESEEAIRYIFQKVRLDTMLSTRVAKQILQSGLDQIPTDSLIPSWNKWFLHCGDIELQFRLNKNYTEQSFSCPWSQSDTTDFAKIIVANYELLQKELDLESYYKRFTFKLGSGKTYSKDGYMMMYTLTNKESKAWRKSKPQRDYLKSIKDTLDNYIEMKLEQQDVQLPAIDCFEDYYLQFSKFGKLTKIKLSEGEKPSISDGLGFYFEDKREIRKCKRLIRQMFRQIDLSHFNLKYTFTRTLSFDLEGEVQLRDNTMY